MEPIVTMASRAKMRLLAEENLITHHGFVPQNWPRSQTLLALDLRELQGLQLDMVVPEE